jgi:hypothetical protein
MITHGRPCNSYRVTTTRAAAAVVIAVVLLEGAAGAWAAPKPLPLRARVIERGEFGPLSPAGSPKLYRRATSWVSIPGSGLTRPQIKAWLTTLERNGFEQALLQPLGRPERGVSWVMQLASSAAAKDAFTTTYLVLIPHVGALRTFSDPAVPGSRGWESSGGGYDGRNILFADGPFIYLVGQAWVHGAAPPPRSEILGSVTHLFRRVHSHLSG